MTDLVLDAIDILLPPGLRVLLKGAETLFGGHKPPAGGGGLTPSQRVEQMLNETPPPGPVTPPGGSGGLRDGLDRAGEAYQQAGGAAAAADAKLAHLLKQIFASNEALRNKVTAIISEIESARKKIAADPTLANDPRAMKRFGEFVDHKLGEIQQLMESAKVESAQQADLLDALTDDYRAAAATAHQQSSGKDDSHSGGGSGAGDAAADGGGGGAPGGGDPGAAGAGLSDPLAGMGLPGGLGGMADPMSMLGPALAGMASIPGAMGGLASSLPTGAMGLAPLAGQMGGAGSGDGFKDRAARDAAKPVDLVDDGHGKDGGGAKPDAAADDHGSGDKKPGTSPSPVPAQTPPAGAVPASAGADPALVVQMPDGSPVTAPSGQHATALRSVVNGMSVTEAWKSAHVDLPPPGTPVTEPADPSHLAPGAVAQFKTREAVMYMGNGKIWLDGQLQPQSTLPTADFLGWVDPTQQPGAAPVTLPAPKAPAGT